MQLRKKIVVLCLGLFCFAALGCEQPNRIQLLKYKRIIKEDRAKKDKAFKFSPNSPIPENKRWQFKKLNYFPVDISYKVNATFKATPAKQELVIQTSSGGPRVYVTMGVFDFSLQGSAMKLTAYKEKAWLLKSDKHPLFVPFMDKTTGNETYDAGRYLDIEEPLDNKAVLDFNLAYNPYCAYNHLYSCPIPPRVNYLPVAIKVGEKK